MSNKGKKLLDLDQLKDIFLKKLDEKLDPITAELKNIKGFLKKRFNYKPVVETNSPKRITEHGQEILEKHKVDSYFDNYCLLLKDENLKNGDEVQVFIKCLNWVRTDGKEKVIEVLLNNNLSQDQCEEFLSLALMKKIKK